MNIINFDQIDSTNAYVKKNIDELPDRTVISADVQTNGYGRFDRGWVDVGHENIYMTIVLKPSAKFHQSYANLTQYLSVCLCKQIESLSLSPKIKWPNDVQVNGKKVCGILAETVFRAGELKVIALGIGINLNSTPEKLSEIDRPATALNLEAGFDIDKKEFMRALLNKFFEEYEDFLKKGFLFIKEDYEKRSVLQMQKCKDAKMRRETIKIGIFNSIKQGVFNGFDDDGTLVIINDFGQEEKINMGEIV